MYKQQLIIYQKSFVPNLILLVNESTSNLDESSKIIRARLIIQTLWQPKYIINNKTMPFQKKMMDNIN